MEGRGYTEKRASDLIRSEKGFRRKIAYGWVSDRWTS